MREQRTQFILSLLAYAVQRGASASEVCRHAAIDLDALKFGQTVPSWKHVNDLWRNACHFCSDPLFGLHFGESLQLAALGAVGEIIKSSDTVGQAVAIAASFTPAVTDMFAMDVEKQKKYFTIRLVAKNDNTDSFVSRQVADFLMVFTVHELNGFLLTRIQPEAVTFPHKLSDPSEYQRVLRTTSIVKKNEYALKFPIQYWDEPIITANYEVQQLFLEKVRLSSSQNSMSHAVSFQVKILDYLMKNSYLGILTLDDVAANFNMSPRSLQRRLQEESTTFQQLADSVRKSLAMHYLQSGKHQIKEISSILGYNELSAFSRAFKRWTGKAPMDYQA
jgi:AraC-like DNA-binding protein